MNLNSREQKILEIICISEVPVHADKLSNHINVSKRSIQYDIRKINDFLKIIGAGEVKSIYGSGYFLSGEQKK